MQISYNGDNEGRREGYDDFGKGRKKKKTSRENKERRAHDKKKENVTIGEEM